MFAGREKFFKNIFPIIIYDCSTYTVAKITVHAKLFKKFVLHEVALPVSPLQCFSAN